VAEHSYELVRWWGLLWHLHGSEPVVKRKQLKELFDTYWTWRTEGMNVPADLDVALAQSYAPWFAERAAAELGVWMVNVHASGGRRMMQAAAEAALASATAGVAAKMTLAEKAVAGLNKAFLVMLAYDAGKMIGELANKFDIVQKSGAYLAQTMFVVGNAVQGMLDNRSFSEIADDISKINAQFEDMRSASSAAGKDVAAAEQKKSDATQQANDALKQQSAEYQSVLAQFKAWEQESVGGIDNVAKSLGNLSDVELAKLKATLTDAFQTGKDQTQELKAALAQIGSEEVNRAWKTLGQESSASLKQAADSAKQAYIVVRDKIGRAHV
jgi:chromosome segregation ATPase